MKPDVFLPLCVLISTVNATTINTDVKVRERRLFTDTVKDAVDKVVNRLTTNEILTNVKYNAMDLAEKVTKVSDDVVKVPVNFKVKGYTFAKEQFQEGYQFAVKSFQSLGDIVRGSEFVALGGLSEENSLKSYTYIHTRGVSFNDCLDRLLQILDSRMTFFACKSACILTDYFVFGPSAGGPNINVAAYAACPILCRAGIDLLADLVASAKG